MLQLLAKHQQRSRQSSKQASRTALPIEQQASDTSTDDIEEPQEPTRTQEVPKDIRDRTWTTLTFQESQKEAMATQTLSSHTLSNSERLAQQLAQMISSISSMERGEVFYGPTDWLGSRDPLTPVRYTHGSSFGLDD
jgi:hypothetical protein